LKCLFSGGGHGNESEDVPPSAARSWKQNGCEPVQFKEEGRYFLQRTTHMTMGMIFYVIAAVILFLAGIGVTAIPNPVIWGLFCVTLGLLLVNYNFGFRRRT
jgi:hypothetical protein